MREFLHGIIIEKEFETMMGREKKYGSEAY